MMDSCKIEKAISAVYSFIADPQERSYKEFREDYTRKAREIGDCALFFYFFRNEFRIDQLNFNHMINRSPKRYGQKC